MARRAEIKSNPIPPPATGHWLNRTPQSWLLEAGQKDQQWRTCNAITIRIYVHNQGAVLVRDEENPGPRQLCCDLPTVSVSFLPSQLHLGRTVREHILHELKQYLPNEMMLGLQFMDYSEPTATGFRFTPNANQSGSLGTVHVYALLTVDFRRPILSERLRWVNFDMVETENGRNEDIATEVYDAGHFIFDMSSNYEWYNKQNLLSRCKDQKSLETVCARMIGAMIQAKKVCGLQASAMTHGCVIERTLSTGGTMALLFPRNVGQMLKEEFLPQETGTGSVDKVIGKWLGDDLPMLSGDASLWQSLFDDDGTLKVTWCS